ncbi:MAG: ABC transporter substrate-binding protein [Alphaproteobacteria bacterium]|nr:ABC transporter substrate-binding protein [Alphaproteobacteria bacterium]
MMGAAAAAVALAGFAAPAGAQKLEKIELFLNWVPGGDHAPYYYARKMKRYEAVGIDLDIQPGKGSAVAIQRAAAGASQLGLADMGAALIARGKGAETVAVMNVYANSPQGLYWLKSSGIRSAKDLAGKKIGNPPGDAARVVFPALAKAVGIDPASVTWVNIDANAKLAALKSKAIDATTSFYNIHHIFQRELGDDMGFLPWREAGVNPYGNSILANARFFAEKKPLVAAFTKVTQKAFADCVADPRPCVEALVEANGALKLDNEMVNWSLVTVLMSDEISRSVALGWHDDKRMAADYELAATYFKLDQAFDVKTVYTNEFLDKSIKMTQPKTN